MSRIFATSDLHGCGDLWDQIKTFLKEDDKLIFLGDAADRGPDGLRIMQEMLADSRIVYLKGNHEWMAFEQPSVAFWIQRRNGGRPTYTHLMELSKEERAKFREKIIKLPEAAEYTNKDGLRIYLCHAGWDMVDPNYDILQERSHFEKPWPEDCEYDVLIHGHTPTGYMQYCVRDSYTFGKNINTFKIAFYCDGHKINLDLGSVVTGAAALLDLDTFEEHYFYNNTYKELMKNV